MLTFFPVISNFYVKILTLYVKCFFSFHFLLFLFWLEWGLMTLSNSMACEEAGWPETPCGIIWCSSAVCRAQPTCCETVYTRTSNFLPSKSCRNNPSFFPQSDTSCLRCHFISASQYSRFEPFVIQVTSCEDDPVIPPLSSLQETRTCVLLRNRRQHTGGCVLSSRLDCEQPSQWRDIVTTVKPSFRLSCLPLIWIHEHICRCLFILKSRLRSPSSLAVLMVYKMTFNRLWLPPTTLFEFVDSRVTADIFKDRYLSCLTHIFKKNN